MDNDSTVEYSDPMYYFMQGALYAEYLKDIDEKDMRFGEFVMISGKMAKYIGTDWPELFLEKDERTAFKMLMAFGRNRHFGKNSSSMLDVLSFAGAE